MKRWILSFTTLLILSTQAGYAEQLAKTLKGQVVTDDPVGLRVMITDQEGTLLDLTDTGALGVYKLDLTVMDTPSKAQVSKLFVVVRDKSGNSKKVPVADYLNIFDETVLLRPITLN
ncbi:MAG: hypothetical protein PVJ63_09100 [Thioalkalispiraceae bacterium]